MDYFAEGNKFYNACEYSKAIDCYRQAIDSKSNIACSYYNSGVCFIKLKDFYSAISMITEALKLQSESKYYFNLGYCHAMLENTKQALINFNIAWSLNNDDNECEKAIKLITNKLKKVN
ncbi:MAG: tetratricopeptide repeat protein [Clostridium sp.]